MSLINDALKKAQNRQGEVAPASGAGQPGPAAVPKSPEQKKSSFGKILIIGIACSVVGAGVSLVVALAILREDKADAGPAPAPKPAATTPLISSSAPSSTTSAAQAPQTPPPVPAAPPIIPVVNPPGSDPSSPAAVSARESAQPPLKSAIAAAPLPAPAPLPPPAAAPPALNLSARIQNFIVRLRITSIRISENGNKAILNDRLFRAGDTIEPSLGLKLVSIEPTELHFVDEAGEKYVRRF
jgi:hypothetical protein